MDAFVMVDWSAASARGPATGRADGLWAAVAAPGEPDVAVPFPTRADARDWLIHRLVELVDAGHRVLCGLDVAFGYPVGTAAALGMPAGQQAWRWMWAHVANVVTDRPDGTNDRFAAAARMNDQMGGAGGPFWGNGTAQDLHKLNRTKGTYPAEVAGGRQLAEYRLTEQRLRDEGRQPKSVWQLAGAGSVGGQALTALPTLWRIRNHPALRDRCRVWPFEDPLPDDQPGVVLAEVYPSLLPDDPTLEGVRDARQVLALVDGYRQMAEDGTLTAAVDLPPDLGEADRDAVVDEEGWVLPVRRDPARARRTSARRPAEAPAIPPGLVEALRSGRCIAFVGAGFAAPEVPTWPALIAELGDADVLQEPVRRRVRALLDGGAHDAAAQVIADALPDGGLVRLLRERLAGGVADQPALRRDLLTAIPFESIVTTNADPGLPGALPGPEAYASLLRPVPAPWWDERRWRVVQDEDGGTTFRPDPPPVLKLHGDVTAEDWEPVFTPLDHRRRLAEQLTFLRSLLATRTVLYLGVSFGDAHLNQVRSEVLALVGHDPRSHPPLGYAVLPDVSPEHQAFYRAHEGIEVLTYDSHGGEDHEGFDAVLSALHEQAGHDALLRTAVRGRRILWVDPAEGRNAPGIRRLSELAGGAVHTVGTSEEAAAVLGAGGGGGHQSDGDAVEEGPVGDGPFDLVITHWGHRVGGTPVGEEVLALVRQAAEPCPVLVFAWGDYADENRPRALALGATDYVWTWPDLFRELARVLGPAPRHPLDLAPRLD